MKNLELGPLWWDTFKREILEYGLIFQRKHLSQKKSTFHDLQRDFYRLNHNDPAKAQLEKELNTALKDITADFNFQKAKEKRLTHERFSAGFLSKQRRIGK